MPPADSHNCLLQATRSHLGVGTAWELCSPMLQPWTTALIDPLWYFQQLTQLIKNAFIRQAVRLLPEPTPPACPVTMLHSCLHQAAHTHPWWGSGGPVAIPMPIPMPMWAAPAPAAEWDCRQHSGWCEGWACLPSQHSLPTGAFTAGEQAQSHLPLQTTAQDAQAACRGPRKIRGSLKKGQEKGLYQHGWQQHPQVHLVCKLLSVYAVGLKLARAWSFNRILTSLSVMKHSIFSKLYISLCCSYYLVLQLQ